jgi:signal transduction histidine kinase
VRRRLLVVTMTLVGVLLTALIGPLINSYAEDRTQDLFVERLVDVTRFAVLAEEPLEGGELGALTDDLSRYTDVYGGAVVVTDANHEVIAASDDHVDVGGPRVSAAVDKALNGSGSAPPGTVWPWDEEPFVVAAPVGRDAQVLGSVVMVSETGSVRDSVAHWLFWLVVAGLATLAATAVGIVGPFVGWIIRPVHDLDRTARRLAGGDLTSRVPSNTGPPELRDLAASFNDMADHVETSQRQQRDLIADAAHQLGNPLTALQLRVEHLRAAPYEPSDIEQVLEETDRLNGIVESLLDLSRVGAHDIATRPTDVGAAVRHRCDMWAPMFTELTVRTPPVPAARASDDLVDLVLDALLDNAAKFADGCAVDVTVGVAGAGTGAGVLATEDGEGGETGAGHIVLTVRDHGPGLDAEDVAKVGARFFRGRAHQNIAGTGLGLAIVRARVEEVGGRFTVSAAPGGGLQAEVRLQRFTPAAPGRNAALPGAGRVGR